jgi:hypothetical protein
MAFDFENYFTSLTKSDIKKTDLCGALCYLCENKDIDIVSYLIEEKITPLEGVQYEKDKDGYYIEKTLKDNCDMTTNFHVLSNENIKISLIINNDERSINKNTKIINLAGRYTELVIRFTFEKEPSEFVFCYDICIAQNNIRKTILSKHDIKCSGFIYAGGRMYIIRFNNI